MLRTLPFLAWAVIPASASRSAIGDSQSLFDTTDPSLTRLWEESSRLLGERLTTASEADDSSRRLQDLTRECGQVIANVPLDHVTQLTSVLLNAFFGEGTPGAGFGPLIEPVLNESLKYGFEASVLCASCDDVKEAYAGAAFLMDDSPHGFLSYCGDGLYGSDLTYSGLLFQPIDPDTNAVFESKMKGSVFMHRTLINKRLAPTAIWPDDLSAFLANTAEIDVLSDLYDVLAAVIAASSGAIAISPDYIGYGQTLTEARSYGVVNLYQQATLPLYLEAQRAISFQTGGCTELDSTATFGGYSEGGYAAVATALAFDSLPDYQVITVAAGGAPFKQAETLQWGIDQYDQGRLPTEGPTLAQGMVFVGNAFSSTNPDLVNSGTGQDALADEWMQVGNYSMNVKAWLANDGLTSTELFMQLIPFPYVPQILRQSLVSLMQAATLVNSTDPCAMAQVNETDKICDVLQENTLFDEVQDTTFPIVICHSPDDEVVPFLNAPDIDANANLSPLAIGPIVAAGTHVESSGPCLFGAFYPYLTAFTGPDTNTMEVADGQCLGPPTAPPVTGPPEPSAIPSESPSMPPSEISGPSEVPSLAPSTSLVDTLAPTSTPSFSPSGTPPTAPPPTGSSTGPPTGSPTTAPTPTSGGYTTDKLPPFVIALSIFLSGIFL